MIPMPVSYLGIDIAKLSFDVALLTQDATLKHKKLPNTPEGFKQLDAWLRQHLVTNLHACLEATGIYGEALARHLHSCGHRVSVVNPAAPKAFARAELSRTKTDKADAIRIAKYCQAHQPHSWTPPLEEVVTLQALVRRLEALQQMHQMEQLRIESTPAAVLPSVQAVVSVLCEQIKAVEKQIQEHIDSHPGLQDESLLLESIPGIGKVTAARLLGELGNWRRFGSARAAAAYVGLVPRLHESGTSVRARSVLCKIGNARLRKALYFPAMNALRYNPVLQAMSVRLTSAGKSKMAIIGAAMRRLVQFAYGVLKSGKPFDPEIAMQKV